MIPNLFQKIFLGLVIALATTIIVMVIIVSQLEDEFPEKFMNLILGYGGYWVQAQLEQTPPEQWSALLEEMQPHFNMPLEILTVEQASTQLQKPLDPDDFNFESGFPPEKGRAYLPLHGGTHYLLIGPFRSPAFPYHIAIVWLTFLFLGMVIVGILIGVPLRRRVRALTKGVQDISRGNLDTRVEAYGKDELSLLAKSMNTMAKRLKDLFEQRQELLQAVSHEIGTPLARMRFHIELLRNLVMDDAQRQRLNQLDDELCELDELGQELIDWVEADAAVLKPVEMDLCFSLEVLAEIEGNHCPPGKNITLQLPDKSESYTISAVPTHFERAIENLLRNAVRYAEKHVTIEVKDEGEHVVVSIRDDGPGIPADLRQSVLEPFSRIEASRSRQQGGVGLGLAIVSRIVQRHGGKIWIEDAPEGGASILTSWPKTNSGPFDSQPTA